MASFASVFGKQPAPAAEIKEQKAKIIKPVILKHARPHASMPVLEVNVYKRDFVHAESLNAFGSLRKVTDQELRLHIMQSRNEQFPPEESKDKDARASADSPFGKIAKQQEINWVFLWDVPMTSPGAARFAHKQIKNELLALDTKNGIQYELGISEDELVCNLKRLIDCEVTCAITDDHITLKNGDALQNWLLENDYTRQEGGFYRLLLNDKNIDTFKTDLQAQCDLFELDLIEFAPEENGGSPPKKARTAA